MRRTFWTISLLCSFLYKLTRGNGFANKQSTRAYFTSIISRSSKWNEVLPRGCVQDFEKTLGLGRNALRTTSQEYSGIIDSLAASTDCKPVFKLEGINRHM